MTTKAKESERLYKVRFSVKDEKDPHEVTVKHVYPSDLMGLVTLEGFIFQDQTKMVILPDEDEMRKRFNKTERLHLPYHQIIFVEEINAEPTDIHNLPFVREIPNHN